MSFPDNASLTAGREGREYVRQRNARGYQQQFPDHASYIRYLSGVSYVQAQRRAAPIPFTEPTNVAVTTGIGSARIAFDVPVSTGGAPVVLYKVIAMPGNIVVTGASSPILVTGLDPGQTYTFTVSAYNGKNTSPPSAITAPVTIATAPVTAPLITLESGDGKLTVSITPPTDNGGSPITDYKYSLDGGMLQSVSTLSNSRFEITGLVNGTTYNVTMLAVNAIGNGPLSPAVTGIPLGVPQAPSITVANNASKLRITVTPPPDTGGSPITGYKYSLDGGAFESVTLTANSTFEITGLTNGRTYTVSVLASNIVGDGVGSTPPSTGKPVTVPAAPAASVVSANRKLKVTITPPTSDGGSPITTYKYSLDGVNFQLVTELNNDKFDITGLTNATTYSVIILAVNAMGDGAISAAVSGTPVGASDPPRNVRATPGNKKATLAFDVPANNGGKSIISYTVTASPGGATATGSASPIEVTGLTNGTPYTFTVVATNSEGDSEPSSASSAIIPDAGSREIFKTVGSGTWTVPDGVTTVEYLIVGGGGGGGGAWDTAGGGGGGGGMVLTDTINVTGGTVISYSVGAGGANGTSSQISPTSRTATSGGDGEASSIVYNSITIEALGGGKGYVSGTNGSGGAPRSGGLASTNSAASTGGDGGSPRPGGGGGGGGAISKGTDGLGSSSNSVKAAGGTGITGLFYDGVFGAGGAGGYGTNTQSATIKGDNGAINTGAGGGGASVGFSSHAPGGAGGSGIIVLKYSLP